jgi:hypothetical protein
MTLSQETFKVTYDGVIMAIAKENFANATLTEVWPAVSPTATVCGVILTFVCLKTSYFFFT